MSQPQSRVGWAGTFVFAGEIVRVRARGFGHHATARVLRLDSTPGGDCEVQLVKVGKNNAGWLPLNRCNIFPAFLEGRPLA